jgi:plastocyanin
MGTRRARTTALALVGAAGIAAGALTGVAAAAGAAAVAPPAVRALSAKGFALAFDKKSLRAPAGRVSLVFTNRSDLAHNVAIRGRRLATPRRGRIVGPGKVSRVTVTLKPGRYTFFCSVFGHESGGMRGTLVVPVPRTR